MENSERPLIHAVITNFPFFLLQMVRSGTLNCKQETCPLLCVSVSHMRNPRMVTYLIYQDSCKFPIPQESQGSSYLEITQDRWIHESVTGLRSIATCNMEYKLYPPFPTAHSGLYLSRKEFTWILDVWVVGVSAETFRWRGHGIVRKAQKGPPFSSLCICELYLSSLNLELLQDSSGIHSVPADLFLFCWFSW